MDDFDLEELRIIPPLPAKAKPKRETEPFAMVPVKDVIAVGVASKNFALLLWLFLRYQARLQRTNTVVVSNKAVEAWGIRRTTKARILCWFEQRGLVTVEQRGKSSPLVTIRT